ncbi:GntR family transcriptional regulator [Brevibacillus composti]|uniref:GntR family transcriptional regulator n=1 Tax=Brevibacillus composti TaxID=2796470 RepID=A0A7T5EP70_9BACL|nr:GntR family transcriptional regulator [Brevibacillus composti]QQE76192.1 GntR family transcriptional regulator [Brevibacillus composti]QUO43221.1 GntR family transcriptional regulator [Brevibacillus composti]
MSVKGNFRSLCLLVMDKIKSDIESGTLKPGVRLPSEADLSKQLGVSRATLREALRLLEEEKIVIRKHGVGTFIHARPVFSGGIGELFSVTDAIERQGYVAGTTILRTAYGEPAEEEQKRLSLNPGEGVLMVERIRTADGEPVVYCFDRIPAQLVPGGYTEGGESIFKWLESVTGIRIAYAVADIEPLGYCERISSLLQCSKATPLLLLKQIHYDESEKPVLYSHNYFRADKFHFQVVRRRL